MRLAFCIVFVLCLLVYPPFGAPAARAASDITLPAQVCGKDGLVALAQLRESLVASFRVKDDNSDGRLTMGELLENAREVFLEMEGKTPGAVSLEDLLSYRCGKAGVGRSTPCPGDIPMGQGLYRHMDLNGDGSVDPAECRTVWTEQFALIDKAKVGSITLGQFQERWRDWFARMDANHDGAVTLDEYMLDQMGAA